MSPTPRLDRRRRNLRQSDGLLGATLTRDANGNCRRRALDSYSNCLKILGSPFFLWEATSAKFCPEETLPVSLEGYKRPEESLVNRQVVDGLEIECIQWRTPHLEAYCRRHKIERDGLVVHFGAHNLYVPAKGCVYVAPSMIAHYVYVHNYEPPAVFWDAVMNCPEMGSETYRQALMVNGPSSHERWARGAIVAMRMTMARLKAKAQNSRRVRPT